jgi:hypothetical protein
MAFTYDDTDLVTNTASGRLNSTRLLLGDTNVLEPQVQDAEVVFALGQSADNVYLAAAWLARVVSMKYAREVDVELDGILSVSYTQLSKAYSDLARDLEYQSKVTGARLGLYGGGITKTGISAVRSNTNRVEPSFRRDQFWNPPSYDSKTIDYGE